MKRTYTQSLIRFSIIVILSIGVVVTVARAGSLTPSASPASTMVTLQQLYDPIAGTYDSATTTASSTGNVLQQLRYITDNTFWASSTGNIYYNLGGSVGVGTTTPIGLFHVATSTTTGLIVDKQGRVGIGTSTPSHLLDVSGTGRFSNQVRAQYICDENGSNCKDIRANRWSRKNGDGTVSSSTKIASGTNGGPTLADSDKFGYSVVRIGDLNNDGVEDVAVGARQDDTGGNNRGAVYILFMNTDGTVSSSVKIAHETNGGPTLTDTTVFGTAVSSVGDLNGDGIEDIVVGGSNEDTGGTNRGSLFVLFMNTDGTVSSSVKIAHETNGGPTLTDNDHFGVSVSKIGDLNNDGVDDIVVGAEGDDTGGTDRGAVYVLFMNTDGTVSSSVKIASGTNGGPTLTDSDYFGFSVSGIGDLDNDGIEDIVAGASSDDTGGTDRGAVYVLFMNTDGTVSSSVKIASGTNGGPTLTDSDNFGRGVASMEDVNGDGVSDISVGVMSDDTGGTDRGAVYVLFMNTDGTVSSSVKIASGTNGGPTLSDSDQFGLSLASIGDLDGNGIEDLVVGASGDDTGGTSRGAFHILFMDSTNIYFTPDKVGIGDTSPDSLLDLLSTSATTTQLTIGNINASDYDIQLGFELTEGTNLFTLGVDDSDGDKFKISTTALGTSDRFVIDSNGLIGIGTTSPSSTLHITGSSTITSDLLVDTNTFFVDATNNGVSIGTTTIVGLLNIATSTTTGLVVDSSGNVGIGTSTPTETLTVFGSSTISNSLNVDSNTLFVDSVNNRVGVGTSTPTSVLTISDNSPTLTIYDADISTTTGDVMGSIQFYSSDGSNGGPGVNAKIETITETVLGHQADLAFFAGQGNSLNERMRIRASGLVGIGTTSPSSTLHITGSSTITSDLLVDTNTFFVDATNNGVSIGTTTIVGLLNIATSTTTGLVVDSSGNVGMGTTTPQHILHVVRGTDGVVARFEDSDGTCDVNPTATALVCSSDIALKKNITPLSNSISDFYELEPVWYNWNKEEDGTLAHMGFIAQSVEPYFPELVHNSGEYKSLSYSGFVPLIVQAVKDIVGVIDVRDAPVSEPSMYIDSSGNIGIGTSTPEYALHIIGDVAATSFVNISTKTSKKDIEYLTDNDTNDALEKIRGINIAQYRYEHESENSSLRLGLIAEEAPKEILAEGGRGVDLYQLTTFVLSGVKAQQIKIEELEEIIEKGEYSQKTLLGSVVDGIKELIVDKIVAREICIEDICIDRDDLYMILMRTGVEGSYDEVSEIVELDQDSTVEEPLSVVSDEEEESVVEEVSVEEDIVEENVDSPEYLEQIEEDQTGITIESEIDAISNDTLSDEESSSDIDASVLETEELDTEQDIVQVVEEATPLYDDIVEDDTENSLVEDEVVVESDVVSDITVDVDAEL